MPEFAVITGTIGLRWTPERTLTEVGTAFGPVKVMDEGRYVVLPRHGYPKKVPPHMIDLRANISAIRELGVNQILSLCSVGSLRTSIKPGDVILPDDYINFGTMATFHDDDIRHITPTLLNALRERVVRIFDRMGIHYRKRGIYIETRGPRLETRAEIAMLSQFGDIVGMTMAREATLAQEAELMYCPVCFVDNFCHGISPGELSFEDIEESSRGNRKTAALIIDTILDDPGTRGKSLGL